MDLTETSALDRTAVQNVEAQAERAGEADIGFSVVAPPSLANQAFAPAGATELFDISLTIEAALRVACCRLSAGDGDLTRVLVALAAHHSTQR